MERTFAQVIGARISASRFEDLSAGVRRYASIGLIDTIGVMLAGAREEAARIARRVVADSTADGAGITLLDAALVNGIAANVIDFDDSTDNLGGHPSSPVLSALLPLAERREVSGSDLMLAYVVGVETETQIGRAVNFHHYEKGWHPTSTLGVFGAAAACARLLRLDAERTATALAIGTSLAAGIKSNFGTMTKPLHIGHAARGGLMAALLAEQGFTAGIDAFDHHHGFLNVFNGEGNHDARRALAKWGTPFDMEFPGLTIKQYPCCLSVQSAIDAALALRERHRIEPASIRSVDVRIAARRLAHTNLPAPRSALEAKLSLQYCLARALLHGEVLIGHFEADAHRDPAVLAMMTRIRAGELPPGASREAEAFDAVIEVGTAAGGTLAGRIERPVGHEPGKPLPEPLLRRKFDGCVAGILPPDRAARLYEAGWGVAQLQSAQELLALARAPDDDVPRAARQTAASDAR